MIDVDLHTSVAVVTVGDCDRLANADVGYAQQLRDAIRDSADLDTVKAIVLRSSGQDFFPALTPSHRHGAQRVRASQPRAWHAAFCAPTGLYQNLAYCKKFTLTEVAGQCAGPGSMLVLCSDHTVCADDARFEAPFADLPESNLVLAMLTLRLNRAKGWVLGEDTWNAAQAHVAGLVNRVTTRQALAGAVIEAAQAAARMPLDGVAMTKLLLEAFLDTQGVGQEFDMAPVYADSLRLAELDDAREAAR
jgi:enoyl-CoA hydratase/carnithine racemase